MNLRSLVYWTLDRLMGRNIRLNYNEVWNSLSYYKGENLAQLETILRWAVDNVDWYKKYSNFKSLSDFPVINKMIIKENEEAFIAKIFNKEKLFVESTSGSTGTPFVVYQDTAKRKRAAADTIVFSHFAGYDLGTRLYYSRVWNDLNRKSKLQSRIQNIVMQDSSRLSDEDMSAFLKKLENDCSEKSVLIFASTLAALYQYMIKNKVSTNAKVKCFITMSESLAEEVRNGIKDLFHTNVVARYSNCECGIIAQQCCDDTEYHINNASFFVETLKFDSDEPAGDDIPGRIVVTDLFNRAMPLIRYDTGDVGVISPNSKCHLHGRVLSRVDGRRIDCIYSTEGKILSPYVINNTLWRFKELNQYQFIQNQQNDYLIKLNTNKNEFNRLNELLMELKKYIGQDAKISVEYVDEIPLLASGKRKQVINNYKPV